MILWGNIKDFSVFMILQLLASYGKSGQLQLEDDEERAVIFLDEGFVQAISVPRFDYTLGSRLVKKGHITEKLLRKIILETTLEKEEPEFLGLTLMKSGIVDKKAIIESIEQQAYDNTLELSNWIKGKFEFMVPREAVEFVAAPRINVQHLLLETSRRLDEGERPKKEKSAVPDDELCATCNNTCSDLQKEKYLKGGICLWRNMPTVARETIYTPETHKMYADDESDERTGDLPFF